MMINHLVAIKLSLSLKSTHDTKTCPLTAGVKLFQSDDPSPRILNLIR